LFAAMGGGVGGVIDGCSVSQTMGKPLDWLVTTAMKYAVSDTSQ